MAPLPHGREVRTTTRYSNSCLVSRLRIFFRYEHAECSDPDGGGNTVRPVRVTSIVAGGEYRVATNDGNFISLPALRCSLHMQLSCYISSIDSSRTAS